MNNLKDKGVCTCNPGFTGLKCEPKVCKDQNTYCSTYVKLNLCD